MSSKLLKVTSLILAVFLLLVTLDVSLNEGNLSKRYLPAPLIDRFRGVGEEVGERLWDTFGSDPVRDALEEHLNDREELSAVEPLARELKGSDILESAWNVLFWEDEHLNYDYSRTEPVIRPIPEILEDGKGICGDYTVLTLAFLLQMNYSPLYALAIAFNDSDTGHLTAALSYRGKLFVVDQHPPVMDLGSYYRYWAVYRWKHFNESPRHIESAVLYRVEREGGSVIVEKVREMRASDFLRDDYNTSEEDVAKVRYELLALLSQNYGLRIDPALREAYERESAPKGYSELVVFKIFLPGYADFYFPEGEEYFVMDIYRKLESEEKIREEVSGARALWIDVTKSTDSLLVILYIGT